MDKREYLKADIDLVIDQTMRIMQALTIDRPSLMTALDVIKATKISTTACELILLSLSKNGWIVLTDHGYVVMRSEVNRVEMGKEFSISHHIEDQFQYEFCQPRVWDIKSDAWADLNLLTEST